MFFQNDTLDMGGHSPMLEFFGNYAHHIPNPFILLYLSSTSQPFQNLILPTWVPATKVLKINTHSLQYQHIPLKNGQSMILFNFFLFFQSPSTSNILTKLFCQLPFPNQFLFSSHDDICDLRF